MKTRHIVFGILTAVWLSAAAVSPASGAALLADLENALMCKCDDKCGKVLVNCTCSTADKTRADFAKMLDSGLTVKQIVQMQVDRYGETVLSAPTKEGFNLTAWMTPFLALVVGGFGIKKALQAWVWKNRQGSDTTGASTEDVSETTEDRYSRRLQDELDKLET